MNWLRNRYNRVLTSLCVGMLAAVLSAGIPCQNHSGSILAWWGTLYPAFCFEEGEEQPSSGTETAPEDGKTAKSRSEPDVKISFWLAKVFDRW